MTPLHHNHRPLRSASAGFTFVETLVAIAILMIAVTGPLTIAQKGISSAVYAKNQMVASYLAQDALEYVKYLRTYYMNKSSTWLISSSGVFYNTCDDASHACRLDTLNAQVVGSNPTLGIIECAGSHDSCDPLKLTANGYDYTGTYAGTVQSVQFKRSFYIQPISVNGNDDAAKVVVTVTWSGDANGSVILDDTLFNTRI